MRILLILPSDSTYKYKGFFKRSLSYAPLTLITLASLVPREFGAQIDIVDEGVQKVCYSKYYYDIVGITCVASSAARAYELASYFKSKGSFVVLGGAHPTLLPNEASEHADAVIVGPGEASWPKLLGDYMSGKAKKIYRCSPSDSLLVPVPRRDLLPKGKYLSVPTVLANRGCSNCCEFCSIHKLWGCKNVTRPIHEVIDEIRLLNTKKILLLDPSPTSNRQYAKELFNALVSLKIKWAGLSTMDTAYDDELLELMIRSGCEGLLVGFESLNQINLNMSRKAFNGVHRYKEAINKFHAGKISILGCFVLGFDHDTKEDFAVIPETIDELGIDIPRFSVLTPFPGTDLYNRLKHEGRILTEDWSLYDTEHVVFEPKNMAPDELGRGLHKIWADCYKIERIIKRCAQMQDNRLLGWLVNMGFRYYSKRFSKLI